MAKTSSNNGSAVAPSAAPLSNTEKAVNQAALDFKAKQDALDKEKADGIQHHEKAIAEHVESLKVFGVIKHVIDEASAKLRKPRGPNKPKPNASPTNVNTPEPVVDSEPQTEQADVADQVSQNDYI